MLLNLLLLISLLVLPTGHLIQIANLLHHQTILSFCSFSYSLYLPSSYSSLFSYLPSYYLYYSLSYSLSYPLSILKPFSISSIYHYSSI